MIISETFSAFVVAVKMVSTKTFEFDDWIFLGKKQYERCELCVFGSKIRHQNICASASNGGPFASFRKQNSSPLGSSSCVEVEV